MSADNKPTPIRGNDPRANLIARKRIATHNLQRRVHQAHALYRAELQMAYLGVVRDMVAYDAVHGQEVGD